MTDMEEQLYKIYKLIFKAPVVTGKISGVLSWQLWSLSSIPWKKSKCSAKAKSSKMASVYIVICMPTHFTDLSENSPSSPNQFKLREE